MPDPDRPSGAPLSESEADRLSERFTASWDAPEAPTVEPATAPLPAPVAAPVAPAPAAAAPVAPAPTPAPAPAPTTPALNLSKPKHTLLGIAPIVVGPSQPPPASPATATPVAAPPPSSPDASSVAQGLTLPAKPYVPKDDASTPAVVISEAALVGTEQAKGERARVAQTIPAQTRSAPVAAATPKPSARASSPSASTLDDTYPPARRKGGKIPLVIAGLVVAVIGVGAVLKLAGGGDKPEAGALPLTPSVVAVAEPVPPPPAPEPPAAAPAPEPPPAAPTDSAGTAAEVAPEAAPKVAAKAAQPEPAPAPPSKKGRPAKKAPPPPPKKAAPPKPVAAPPKPVAAPKPAAAVAAFPPAPEPAPAPKPAKGVIVRETPF